MKRRILITSVLVSLALIIPMVVAVLTTQITIPGSGTTAELAPTPAPTSNQTTIQLSCSEDRIDWGNGVTISTPITRQVSIRNTGTVPVTLSMAAKFQGVSTSMITWDKEGIRLNPNELTTATFTFQLDVKLSPRTTFSTEVTITGTQTV